MNHTAVNTIKTPDRTPTATVMVSESEYQKKKKKKMYRDLIMNGLLAQESLE